MDGEPPQEEDFTQIPLLERSQHKNWKARLSAYTDVVAKSAKTASDTDPFFRPYVSDGPLLKRWVTDANVVAQEKGIEAVLAIAQYSGESSAKCRSDLVPSLVEKALGAARAGTKRKATDLCLMMVEVENTGEGVMADVLPGLDAKQPKVVAGCVTCLKEVIESFGVAAIGNIKPLMKALPKIFGHSDKTVRSEGSLLVLALYTYLGAALRPSLADLKPVQLAELQKSFDALDAEGKGAGTGRPSRYTRKAQREREAAEASGSGAAGDGMSAEVEEPAVMDARDLLDPVDVSKLFPGDLDERLSSSKWKDRLEALEEVNTVLANPKNAKIADGSVDSYGSLVQTLGGKCKSDANINVVIEAAKVIEGLARGLGKPFGRYRSVVMSGMLERLKERKATVVEALGRALDAVFSTVPFSDIVEDVLASLKSKNPQVKESTLKFLHRSLCCTTDAPGKDQVKPMAEALVSLLGDSAEPVRSSAADCLGTMMKILGERAFNPFVEGVGELQMTKVKDAFAKAEIRYRAGGAAGAKAAPKPAAGPPKKPVLSSSKPSTAPSAQSSAPSSPPIKASGKFDADALMDDIAAPARAPPARFMAKAGAPKPLASSGTDAPPAPAPAPVVRKPPTAAPPAAKTAAPPKPAAGPSKPSGGASKTLATSPSEPVKYRFTPEDAAAKAVEQIPADYHTKLADAAWKTRLEAAEEMVAWVQEGAADGVDCEVLFRFFGKTPGWGEKNFQVSAKLYDVMRIMAEKSSTFGKPSAALAIGHLSDKLGDLKLRKPSGDALTTFAEKTSLAFVLAQAYEPMTKQKAPKAQADALTWIKQQLVEFGISGIPLKDLISFVKTALGSPNALVRKSATEVLVAIRVAVGADISGFIEDLNPQLLSTINSEFDKAASQTPPEPSRTQADLQEAAAAPGKSGKGGGADPLDDLIPRVDLDKLVNQTTVIADSKSDAWKTRKEAFEALNALLEIKSNSRLKPNMGEIGGVLKKAMADTNLAVKMLALGIITKIATGMDSAFDKYTRLLTAPVASVCADQKATTRSAGIATLTAMADAAGGLDTLYAGLASALESPNPALRSTVLGWMAERLAVEPPTSAADLSCMAGPVISCLEDRNGDVRKGAGAILPFVVANAGYDHVMSETSRLKPASKATIVPLINNARAAAPSASKSDAPAAVAATGAPKPAAGAAKPGSKPASANRSAPSSPGPGPAPAAVKPSGIQPPARSLVMKALANAPTARPPSALSDDRPTGIPRPKVPGSRPQSTQPAAVPESSGGRIAPFLTSDPGARASRLKKDTTRWILEASPKADLTEYLHTQMEPHTAPEMLQLLFSKDHRAEEDFMAALSTMAEFYDTETSKSFGLPEDELAAVQMANVDLTVKYAAIKLLSNNTQLANRCLEVIGSVFATLMRLGERFSDPEAKLFMPAIVFKLGDAKFSSKLTPLFETLDKIIAGSQVIQLLVQYGLEDKSAGKTCKNESLALIEKAYRKRGSILRVRDDRGFYETLAKCVSDSGTRNAALSVMALLQLQGPSKTLEAVIESMPSSSKDMLANRRATMATTKNGPVPLAAKVAAAESSIPAASPRIRKPVPRLNSPAAAAGTRNGASTASPTAQAQARTAPDSPSRLPKSSAAARSGIPGPAANGRPVGGSGIPFLAKPVQRDFFTAKPSMQPLGRPSNSRGGIDLIQLINDVRQDDVDDVVDALKVLQDLLSDGPERFNNVVSTLVDTLVDEMERAFTPPENILEGAYFRLVKHLLQTMSSVSSNEVLLRRLTYDSIYVFFDSLTIHLVQCDLMGGQYKELSKFINLILIQILAQTDRLIMFTTMFRLLYRLAANYSQNHVMDKDPAAAQADLVMKCLWKRSKVLDDDLASGRLSMGALMRVVEEFMAGISPSEWRRRGKAGIALGDFPLRTVKSMIQKLVAYCKVSNQEVYDILLEEFGDDAANTTVYAYVFRLAGGADRPNSPEANEAVGEEDDDGVNGRPPASASHAFKSATSRPVSVATAQQSGSSSTQTSTPQRETEENDAAKMLRNLMRPGNVNQPQNLDMLYDYMKADPSHEAEVERAISAVQSGTVQTYLRRVLEQRRIRDNPSPARPDGPLSPTRSPIPRETEQFKPQPRRSMAGRPASLVVDKSAPADAQLADYKNLFFNRGGSATGALRASQSQDTAGRNGTPLSDIGSRANALERDVD